MKLKHYTCLMDEVFAKPSTVRPRFLQCHA